MELSEKLNSWKDVSDFLKNNQVVDLDSLVKVCSKIHFNEEWVNTFCITINGNSFHGSITANIAQSIIDMQNSIYNIAETIDRGKFPTRPSYKGKPEFMFSIKEGCTLVELNQFVEAFSKLSKSFNKMNNSSKMIISFLILAALAGYFGTDYLKTISINKTEIELQKLEKQDRANERETYVKVINALNEPNVATGISYAYTSGQNIIDSFVSHASPEIVDSLDFNGKLISKEKIIELQQPPIITTKKRIWCGWFIVKSINGSNESYMNVKVKDEKNRELTVRGNVYSEEDDDNSTNKFLSDDEFETLWHAMKNHTKVWLLVNLSEDAQGKLTKTGHVIYSVSEKKVDVKVPEITFE